MNTPSPFCLLLVEENEATADRLTALLDDETCSFIRFRNGDAAQIWLADDQTFALVMADADNGPTVARRLRSDARYQSKPVLIVDQSINHKLMKTAIDAGATDVLALSEDDPDLRHKIYQYADLSRQLQSLPQANWPSAAYQLVIPWWKRAIDIIVALVALILLSPVLLIVALLIAFDSKGPILYKSKRAGTNFRVFNMYKFRTMQATADQQIKNLAPNNIYSRAAAPDETDPDNETEWLCNACRQRGVGCQQLLFDQTRPVCEKLYLRESEEAAKFMKFRNDPRITRLGTFLRNSSIDELPQLINILLGDMSLVGNRPLPLYEAEKLTSDESVKRFAGPAGLTGLWQVKKRAKGEGAMSDRERILLDIDYAGTFSFKTDMAILWRTFFSLWQKENV